ncbi:hypothetical protein L207DRAFT_638911 [Hyaloscypha variabilis F]|uniref:Uncharacterized protein n=1 Tax=Hyaloscypha variabilis (strain UAMH 11265 / GT02V1 / F) TaxID=1149755 RepID=A0A2J6R7E6_HYAVF|nr:hypothetical protein L207DRAFT_638911 [Hyaloscypha variabilis F]
MFGNIFALLSGNGPRAERVSMYEHGLQTKAQEDLWKSWRAPLTREQVRELWNLARGSDEQIPDVSEGLLDAMVAYFDCPEGNEFFTANARQALVDGKLGGPPWAQWCAIARINLELLKKSFWKEIRSDDRHPSYMIQTVLKQVLISVGAPEAEVPTMVDEFLLWAVKGVPPANS